METRAQFYLRKSRALGDGEDSELLATHRALLHELAAADGLTIEPADIHEEIGSAEEIDYRPVFRRLLAEWERLPRGSGGILYVVDLIRLTRGSGADWARIHAALAAAGIKIRTRTRLFDPRDPDDTTWMEFESFFGRVELRYMKARAALARRQMTRDGRVLTGEVPYGYVWNEKTKQPDPDPERFPILQRACRLILTHSVLRVAALTGIPLSTLAKVLKNPMICGWPAQRYQSRPPGKPYRERPWLMPTEEWRWPEKPGSYPAACTRAEWEAIQTAMAARFSTKSKTGGDGWCRDVLMFEGASGRVRLGSHAGYLTYDLIRDGEPRLFIRRGLVHEAATGALAALFSSPTGALIVRMAAEALQAPDAAPRASGRARQAIEKEIERKRQALIALRAAEAEADPEEARAAVGAHRLIRQRLRELTAELAAADEEASGQPDFSLAGPLIEWLAADFPAVWETVPPHERRPVAALLLAAVRVRVVIVSGQRRRIREVLGCELREWVLNLAE